jgi:ribosomal protein L37AE/L43A
MAGMAEVIVKIQDLRLRERDALEGLLRHVDSITCKHENTHRGGAIWTICDECGRKWADDEGGFKPYRDPPEVKAARKALSAGQPLPGGE